MPAELRIHGSLSLYRQFDVGYVIDLDRVTELLGSSTRGRARPVRFEARAIQIRNPPVVAALDDCMLTVDGVQRRGSLAAHIFDFGVCSLRLAVDLPEGTTWPGFVDFAVATDASPEPPSVFDRELAALLRRIDAAIERRGVAPLFEDYKVYRIDRVTVDDRPADGAVANLFPDAQLAPLLVGERRPVSAATLRELLPYRFSYHDDDLAVLSWEAALVVEPRVDDHDVEYVLEFANAQLLELRMFDQQLDAELPALYDRVEAVRGSARLRLTGKFRTVISALQTRVADVTETVERVENALKVTNDVYLARIYAAALELFRERAWRRGIERKLGILRDTYAMLNDEAQASRMELLELVVVLLIFAEIALALLFGHF
jgi:hypothetical protein